MTKQYLTTKEMAEIKGMTKQGIINACKNKRLIPAAKIGKVRGFEANQEIKSKKDLCQ